MDTLAALLQDVPRAADGVDEARLAPSFELLAQVPDVDFDHLRLAPEVGAPDAVVDEVAREDLSRMLQEELQELVLGGGEADLAGAAARFARGGVEAQVGIAKLAARDGLAAAELDADAGEQLFQRERLDQVVVGAALETGDPVGHRVAGGEQ